MPLLKNNTIVPDTWIQAGDDVAILPECAMSWCPSRAC